MKKKATNFIRKTKSNLPSVVVVSPVNDDKALAENLAASPMLKNNVFPLIVKRNYESAALAYNSALNSLEADIFIFAHQDVYIPSGWEKKLFSTIESLDSHGKKWAVLGVIGADKEGNTVGGAWSTGLWWKIETNFLSPAPVRSFDEIVIILRKDSGLRFDDNLPDFHLYGTDIAQSALKAGLGAYVFDAPVIHNSLWRKKLGISYCRAYRYMQLKWRSELPIYTLVLPITRTQWPLLRNWCREKKRWFFRQIKPMRPRIRHNSPGLLAQELGYVLAEQS